MMKFTYNKYFESEIFQYASCVNVVDRAYVKTCISSNISPPKRAQCQALSLLVF